MSRTRRGRARRPDGRPRRAAPGGARRRRRRGPAEAGLHNSWVTYGPGWAQAASAPSRLFKGFTTEGGTRVVGFASGEGVRGGGRVTGAFLHVTDIAPTLLDVAGVRVPRTFEGRRLLAPEGRSLARLLRGRELEVRAPRETVGWELFFRRAVRQGDWKAVYLPGDPSVPYRVTGREPARWELYDLKRDPGETTDLAERHPRRLRRLVRAWEAYAARTGVVLPAAPAAQAAAAGPTPRPRTAPRPGGADLRAGLGDGASSIGSGGLGGRHDAHPHGPPRRQGRVGPRSIDAAAPGGDRRPGFGFDRASHARP